MPGVAASGGKGLNMQRNDVVRRPAFADARFHAERNCPVRRWVSRSCDILRVFPPVNGFGHAVCIHSVRAWRIAGWVFGTANSSRCEIGALRLRPHFSFEVIWFETTHSQSLRPSSDGSADMGRAQKYICACVNACKRETLTFVAQAPCARGCPFICNCPRHRSRRGGMEQQNAC